MCPHLLFDGIVKEHPQKVFVSAQKAIILLHIFNGRNKLVNVAFGVFFL
jgi:hypothetical protein